MTVSNGEIWLANLNPVKRSNEIGKTRPVLVFQNDIFNHSDYPTTIILPLSTHLVDDAEPIRYRIVKQDDLLEDSDIVITQIRSIDNSRFIKKLTSLSQQQMQEIKKLFYEII